MCYFFLLFCLWGCLWYMRMVQPQSCWELKMWKISSRKLTVTLLLPFSLTHYQTHNVSTPSIHSVHLVTFTVCTFNASSKISQVLFSCIDFSSESFGITLLRPCPEISTHWLSCDQDEDIIPTNLKSRKWESFPASEVIRNL